MPAIFWSPDGTLGICNVQMCEVYITSQHRQKSAIRARRRYKFAYQNDQITKLSSCFSCSRPFSESYVRGAKLLLLFKFPPLSAETGDTQCWVDSQSSAYSSRRSILRALLFCQAEACNIVGLFTWRFRTAFPGRACGTDRKGKNHCIPMWHPWNRVLLLTPVLWYILFEPWLFWSLFQKQWDVFNLK